MNTILKTSFIAILLLHSLQSSYANNSSDISANSLQIATNEAHYILPPPSPFFSSSITNFTTQTQSEKLDSIATPKKSEDAPLGNLNLENRIHDLEIALKNNQEEASDLVEELHATAKNADFENEMYEKTVSVLQEKINTLTKKNKTLTTKFTTMESTTGSQQQLLSTLKQDSAELATLKSKYQDKNKETLALKEQLTKLKQQTQQINNELKEVELKTLRDAYTVKSDESEGLKVKLQQAEKQLGALQNQTEAQKIEFERLNKKLFSYDHIQAELVDLQALVSETDENNELLEVKIIELDEQNNTLKSQLDKMQHENNEQSQKINRQEQSLTELTTLKSANKKINEEVTSLKEKLSTAESNNKALLAEIDTLKSNADEANKKLGLLEQTSAELTALKSALKERNNEISTLKIQAIESDTLTKSLQSKIEQLENAASTQ